MPAGATAARRLGRPKRNKTIGAIMHNLHFKLIKADTARYAAFEAENLILDWGNENNWRSVGGIASEDGSDDVENDGDGRWGLSFLDHEDSVSKKGTYLSRVVAYLDTTITEPVTLRACPGSAHSNLRLTIVELGDLLRAFDHGDSHDLWRIGRDLKHVSELIDARRARERGEDIPQFYEWQFDHFGLTDMTEQSDGARRYLVFLDMHS
jgi:hypothetical protein